jgi:hypothetical protein
MLNYQGFTALVAQRFPLHTIAFLGYVHLPITA